MKDNTTFSKRPSMLVKHPKWDKAIKNSELFLRIEKLIEDHLEKNPRFKEEDEKQLLAEIISIVEKGVDLNE